MLFGSYTTPSAGNRVSGAAKVAASVKAMLSEFEPTGNAFQVKSRLGTHCPSAQTPFHPRTKVLLAIVTVHAWVLFNVQKKIRSTSPGSEGALLRSIAG